MFTPREAPEVLTQEQLGAVHEQSMALLQDVGLDVLWAPARDVFAAAGNKVDGVRVRFDRDWIMDMVGKIPSTFVVQARNPERNITVGGGSRIMMPVGGSPFVSDLDMGRRRGSLADHDTLVRLGHSADVIRCLQSATVEAVELPVATRHMDMDYSVIRNSDKPYATYGASGPKVRDGIAMAEIWAGGRAAIEETPAIFVIINPNSPLVWDERMADALMTAAEANQPVVLTPFLLAGGTSPVSLAGGLSIQVAEALSGAALAQAVRPGVPCMYGTFFTPLDMRTGSPAFGLPEGVLATLAGAQLARFYGMPYRGGGALASGNCVDAQTASEATTSLWATYLSSSDLVLHAAGWLEGGLTASFEKFALDVELLTQLERTALGIGFSEEELAREEIASMGPGGMYLESAHTMAHFKEWVYMSPLFTTPDFNTWEAMGSETLDRRANAAWKRMLGNWEDPGIAPGVDEALKEYMARRKAEEPDADE